MQTRSLIYLCLLAISWFGSWRAQAEEPRYVVSASDWHSAEGGVVSKVPEAYARNQAEEAALVKGTVFCAPEVVLIAGDVGSRHWTEGALKKAGAMLPGESIEAAINRRRSGAGPHPRW